MSVLSGINARGRSFVVVVVIAACGGDGGEPLDGATTSGPSSTSIGESTTASTSGGTTSTDPDTTTSSSSAEASTSGVVDSTSDDGSTGDPPKGNCASDNLVGCWRGMYLSPYTDHTGGIVFDGETEEHQFILGDAAKEQIVLDFIAAHRVESIALYDLNTILQDEDLSLLLASFMDRARDAGVLNIEAIAAENLPAWDRIADFHEQHAPFDGFVTEIEFWNGGATFEDFMAAIEYADALGLVAPSGEPPTVSVYVGWLEYEEVEAMLPFIDRAYVHAYVDDAANAFGYAEERIEMYADANEAQGLAVEIRPIYSAEDEMWSAGAETFMGEWLAQNGLDVAEVAFLGEYEASPLHDRIVVSGQQYFSYFFLERYLP